MPQIKERSLFKWQGSWARVTVMMKPAAGETFLHPEKQVFQVQVKLQSLSLSQSLRLCLCLFLFLFLFLQSWAAGRGTGINNHKQVFPMLAGHGITAGNHSRGKDCVPIKQMLRLRPGEVPLIV